jgi:hypothetical protein
MKQSYEKERIVHARGEAPNRAAGEHPLEACASCAAAAGVRSNGGTI